MAASTLLHARWVPRWLPRGVFALAVATCAIASSAQTPEKLGDWVRQVAESSRTPIEAPFFAE